MSIAHAFARNRQANAARRDYTHKHRHRFLACAPYAHIIRDAAHPQQTPQHPAVVIIAHFPYDRDHKPNSK